MNRSASAPFSRRLFLRGSLAATGGLLIAGCSDTAPGGGGQGGQSVANLRVGIPTDVLPGRLLLFSPQNQPVRRTVFDYLIDLEPDGSYKPSLATAWEWNSDNTNLVLTLREDVTFHNGRSFGPDDVIFLIQTALIPETGAQVAQLLKRGGEVTKTGTNQVSISFAEPFARYLDALTALPVVDSATYATTGEGREVIGTGPFTWKNWTAGSTLEMEQNSSYWDGTPTLEAISFSVVAEPQAMLAAMRSGDLDMVDRMVPRDAASLEDAGGFWAESAVGNDIYVGANTAVQPLDDMRVRQAISYAIDRARIVDQVYQGIAQSSCVAWPASTPGVTGDQVERYPYDVEKGAALIEEAGVTGVEIAITPSPADPAFGAIHDIVQFGLEQIGLRTTTVTYDAAEYPEHLQAGDLPGLFIGQVALTSMGPTTALLTASPFRTDKNTHNFNPPEYKTRVDAVVAASDDDRPDATNRLTDYMLDQAFHNVVVQAASPIVGVEGLSGVEVDITQAFRLARAKLVK